MSIAGPSFAIVDSEGSPVVLEKRKYSELSPLAGSHLIFTGVVMATYGLPWWSKVSIEPYLREQLLQLWAARRLGQSESSVQQRCAVDFVFLSSKLEQQGACLSLKGEGCR
ncbi:hypothetical protein GOP47_0003199 [Adiantum capillus-veneris]|uniref:Uncharacterized protein n=1 Tax=Adiantum capillus-veneris TaxID=13818 RepID=A0A9D4ZRL6_ADICA|nr:hypothetical protein GOP47_0003199 [Adiantum capillus-veneris]